tara:strand:+ start:119 stop:724 length:606 start_codon:yes stop_codon:yes gene_type:complete
MRFFFLYLLISILFFGNLKAEDYSGFLVGYTKHIAEDPHDSEGSTYVKDPEENGLVIGYFNGQRSDGTAIEGEVSYYTEVTQNLTTGVNVDVSTLTSMLNLMATPGDGELYGILGGGIGIGYTMVDTSFKSGSTTFNGDNETLQFGYQLMVGFGSGNYEVLLKRANFGEVKGGSGTTSAGGSYAADEFDNIYNSLVFKIKY